MLAPDTILQGRYRIIRQLVQGGMGAVYEAMDARLDTTIALKETLFADERLRKQFEREARLLARMHHPALPRVSDHFSEGDGQFLVMQFIAGDDLAEMMTRKQGAFPPDQVLRWADQLLDALDYLHTQDPQIIHRDIKPQNLKLTGRGQIILLDFGLAKGQSGEVSRVTTTASIFGYTPNYAPLEQIQGLGTDARSDIYALGATLYHLLTGVKPPDALTRAAAIVNGQPDPLKLANEVNAGVGPGVAQTLARAMAQNRDQRYATAAAMRAALHGTAEVATVTGRSEAATVLFSPPSQTLAATQADVKQTGVGLGETTVVKKHDAPLKRRVAPWAIAASVVILLGIVFGAYYAYQHRNVVTSTAPTTSSTQENTALTQPSSSSIENTAAGGSDENSEAPDLTHSQIQQITTAKSEKTAKDKDKIADKASTSAAPRQIPTPPKVTDERDVEPKIAEPEIPDANTGVPQFGRRIRRPGGVSIRNFPDGTQVITSPDGTRVVVRPDGSRQVFRPGDRINRRRIRP